jgi:hypothetical protein
VSIEGVEITADVLGAMIQAGVAVQHQLGRRLTGDEVALIVRTTLRHLAARRPAGATLH